MTNEQIESEISQEVNLLDNQMSQLMDAIHFLEERLGPVLSTSEPTRTGTGQPMEIAHPSRQSDLGRTLDSLNGSLSGRIAMLRELSNRVQL